MKIILSVGGSVIGTDLTAKRIRDLTDAVKALKDRGDEIHLVIGGGPMKQIFADVAREIGLGEYTADILGICLTRVYAKLISSALGDTACPQIPESIEEALRVRESGKTVVMGGTEAGHSTTAVAALFAEAIGADMLLKLTDVDGVFSKNPKLHKDAVRYDELTYGELSAILGTPEYRAGTFDVLDAMAIGLLQRSSIPTIYFNGAKSMTNILRARDFEVGTYISSDKALRKVSATVKGVLKAHGFVPKAGVMTRFSPSPRNILAAKKNLRVVVVFRSSGVAGRGAILEAVAASKMVANSSPMILAERFPSDMRSEAKRSKVKLARLSDLAVVALNPQSAECTSRSSGRSTNHLPP